MADFSRIYAEGECAERHDMKTMKNILFAASECVPFVKTGGLADVVGALPKSLDHNNYDVRVILPNYTCIPWEYRSQFR